MKIISCKKVTWEIWKPFTAEDYPCFSCRKEIATYEVKCKKEDVMITMVLCHNCLRKKFY